MSSPLKGHFATLIAALLLMVAALLWMWQEGFSPAAQTFACGNIKEERVQGGSLAGLEENGSIVKIWYGFQECDQINRNDVVVYKFAGKEMPLLKVVKAVPGDTFQVGIADKGVKVFVNSEVVRNAQGEVYLLGASAYDMLSLYVRDYHGVIPESAYLLLGNLTGGSLDSSKFGLVDGGSISGKLVE